MQALRQGLAAIKAAHSRRFVLRAVPFIALLMASCLPLPALAQGPTHDGRWRVELETTVGKCAGGGSTIVTIKLDRVVGIDASGVEPWGYIDETNTFVGHFNSGQKVLRANGDVRGATASGPWSSQTEYCGGRWTAHKID
jgi:hypothetical protein